MIKAIVIGGNHHNGLNLGRILGINGISVDAYVITKEYHTILNDSKYIDKCKIFLHERDAYDYIKNHTNSYEIGTFIIPYSDGAAMELDSRLNEFREHFHIPSIREEEGRITELMDKRVQYEWAISKEIKMAQSLELRLKRGEYASPFTFPVILKPIVSASGDKHDIEICDNQESYNRAIDELLNKGYTRILIQPYLNVDYEIDVFGCVCKGKTNLYLVPTKTLRAWPLKKGTNCFSQIITDPNIIDACKHLLSSLIEEGFYGLYDAELLMVNGELYLNEINFRNSGDDYMGLTQKFYYPVYWINDVLHISNEDTKEHPDTASYAMTVNCDFRHVLKGKLSLVDWLKDVTKTKDFALAYRGDMKPAIMYYCRKISNRLFLKFSGIWHKGGGLPK